MEMGTAQCERSDPLGEAVKAIKDTRDRVEALCSEEDGSLCRSLTDRVQATLEEITRVADDMNTFIAHIRENLGRIEL